MNSTIHNRVNSLSRKTGVSTRQLQKDVKQLTDKGIDPNNAIATVEYHHTTEEEQNIFEIAAISWYRGHHLLNAGYDSIASVARASLPELQSTTGISTTIAPVISESARALHHRRNLVMETARSIGADSEELTAALSLIRAAGVTVDTATETLEGLYAPQNRPSLIDVAGIDHRRAYFLYDAGYRTIADVATAEPSTLADLRYLSLKTAKKAIDGAQEHTTSSTSEWEFPHATANGQLSTTSTDDKGE